MERSQLMRNEAELTKAVETIGRLQQQVQEVRQSVSTALVSYMLYIYHYVIIKPAKPH